MIFYLSIVGGLILLAIILRPDLGRSGRAWFALLSFATLATFAAIRAPTVGADTLQYYRFFTIIGHLSWSDRKTLRFESGYFLLNKVFYAVTDDPQVFIAVTNIFVIAVVTWFLWKYSKNILFSV